MSMKFSGPYLNLKLRTIRAAENDHEYHIHISSPQLAFDDFFVPFGQEIVLRASGSSIEIFYQKGTT